MGGTLHRFLIEVGWTELLSEILTTTPPQKKNPKQICQFNFQNPYRGRGGGGALYIKLQFQFR